MAATGNSYIGYAQKARLDHSLLGPFSTTFDFVSLLSVVFVLDCEVCERKLGPVCG